MLRLMFVLSLGLMCLTATAYATPPQSPGNSAFGRGHHGAPAPLLAAGIPAFAALGGGAFLVRVVRRMKRRA